MWRLDRFNSVACFTIGMWKMLSDDWREGCLRHDCKARDSLETTACFMNFGKLVHGEIEPNS